MTYRTVYNDEKVLTSVENNEITVTSSLEEFIIDTIPNTIDRLASQGVDVSYFWKNGQSPRIQPVRDEISISDHPTIPGIQRKAFVWRTNTDYTHKKTFFCVIVRHFIEGEHVPLVHEDLFVSAVLTNDKNVDNGAGVMVGEYDYLYSVVNSKAYSLFELEDMRVSILDQEGKLNNY